MLGYVFVVALVALRCSRKGIEGHEIALVIMLSVIVAICLRQLFGFFRAGSSFREPAVQRALPSIVMIRSAGCLLLINSMFNLIPELPSEFLGEDFFGPTVYLNQASVYLGLILVMMPAFKSVNGTIGEGRMLDGAVCRLAFIVAVGTLVISAGITNGLVFLAVFGIELGMLRPASMGRPFLSDEHLVKVLNRDFFARMSLLSMLATLGTAFGFQFLFWKRHRRFQRIGISILIAGFAANIAFLIWTYNFGLASLTTMPIELRFFENGPHFTRLIAVALVLVTIFVGVAFGSANRSFCFLTGSERKSMDLPTAIYVFVPIIWLIGLWFKIEPGSVSDSFFDNANLSPPFREPPGGESLRTAIGILKVSFAAICLSKINFPRLFRRSYRWVQASVLIAIGLPFVTASILRIYPLRLFHLENGFAGIAVVGLFAVVSIVLLRKPRLTCEDAKLLDASPKECSFLSFASVKLWFLIPACAIVAVVTVLSMIWSSVGVVMFTDWVDPIIRTLQF